MSGIFDRLSSTLMRSRHITEALQRYVSGTGDPVDFRGTLDRREELVQDRRGLTHIQHVTTLDALTSVGLTVGDHVAGRGLRWRVAEALDDDQGVTTYKLQIVNA